MQKCSAIYSCARPSSACLEPICRGLVVETDLGDEQEALAHDNFVSARESGQELHLNTLTVLIQHNTVIQ